MRALSACPAEGPGLHRGHREHWLVDRKDGADERRDPLTLILTSDAHDFVLYSLDRSEVAWEGKRPDGVLLADLGDRSLVCFIELKATMKGDPEVWARATAQLRGGISHFCPNGRLAGPATHGDEHHDQWCSAAAVDPIALLPDREHLVMGAVVAFRQAPPRILPIEERSAGKRIPLLLLSIPMAGYNRATLSLEDFCLKLGLKVAG